MIKWLRGLLKKEEDSYILCHACHEKLTEPSHEYDIEKALYWYQCKCGFMNLFFYDCIVPLYVEGYYK